MRTTRTPDKALSDPITTEQSLATLAEWFFIYCQSRNLAPKTIRFYRFHLGYLVDELGGLTPEQVTTTRLRQAVVSLQKTRAWTVTTTNHFITVTRVFFNYLLREELTDATPTRRLAKLKTESHLPSVLTQEEVAALLVTMQDTFSGRRDRLMVLTLLDTGVRLHELLTLTLADLDMKCLQFRVFGKGRKERMVPFSPTLGRYMAKYLPQRATIATGRALWVNRYGEGLSETHFVHILKTYGVKAQLTKSIHPHLFRHTFATEFLRNDGNPQMLQRILGHTTQAMTQRYVHVTDTDASNNHRTASPLEHWPRVLPGRGTKKQPPRK